MFEQLRRAAERLRRSVRESSLARANLDLLADDRAAVLENTPLAAHAMLWGALAFLVVALVWAALATLDEVTRAEGQVIPSQQIQVIQNLEGGIVKDLLVREGQTVAVGQVLLRIDEKRFSSTYQEGRIRYLSLLAKIARLQAETTGTEVVMPPEVLNEAPAQAQDELRLYTARALELSTGLQVLDEQRNQKRQEVRTLQGRVGQLGRSAALLEDELARTQPLAAEGVVSEVEILRLRRQVNETQGDLSAARAQLPQAQAGLAEAERKIEETRASFRAKAQGELAEAKGELAATGEANLGARDRLERTQVRSPVRGIVKRLHVNTVGGVIQPGSDIVEVVPLEDSLLVEGRVKPRDIAFLHPGLPAIVKLTAYDYAIYGGLTGTLEHISADAITEKRGDREETFYLIRVRTKDSTLRRGDNVLPVIPGMTASVDVLTGRKTVLSYLLKPVFRAKERALRER